MAADLRGRGLGLKSLQQQKVEGFLNCMQQWLCGLPEPGNILLTEYKDNPILNLGGAKQPTQILFLATHYVGHATVDLATAEPATKHNSWPVHS